MGDVCEEWMICDLAAQSLGAITYGIYPTAAAAEVEYQMRDGGACVFIAEDQEYVDKILPMVDRLPDLRAIVVLDDSAMFGYAHEKLHRFADLLAGAEKPELAWLEKKLAGLSPADPAFIVYTSGTTGHPKGALVSHGKHLAATDTVIGALPDFAGEAAPHGRLSADVPCARPRRRHHAAADVATGAAFRRGPGGFRGHIVRGRADGDVHRAALSAEVRLACAGRRAQFQLASSAASTNLPCGSRASMRAAAGTARRPACTRPPTKCCGRWFSGRSSTSSALTSWSWWSAVVRRYRRRPPSLWQIYGVNVVEMYGQTEEAGGIIAGQRGPFARPGNVGTAVEGVDVTLADDGEVLVRSPDLFDCYWQNDEATREVMRADGWLRTGDIGEWRDGALRLVDRARDFIVTVGGKTISPSFIENALRASPYVAEAVVFGHGRKYLTAVIEIDFDTVADWARTNNVGYTGFTSLTTHPQIERLMRVEIDRVNGDLARVEQIKSFRILPKALDPEEEGEPVTPTRKVKRKLMYERFRDLVDGMYDDSEERLIAAGAGDIKF